MREFVILLSCYLLGAIPFGVIAAKICGVDIFKIGSGSTGTTNVIRACGKAWGLTVLLLDAGKGALATYLGMVCFANNYWLVVLCGIAAMLGHSYSIFIRFRGGKSAATGMGIILALDWRIFLITAIFVFIVRQTTGYQSVASLLGALLAVVLFCLSNPPYQYIVIIVIGALFIWIKHLSNIKRLLNGTETKIVSKKKKGKK